MRSDNLATLSSIDSTRARMVSTLPARPAQALAAVALRLHGRQVSLLGLGRGALTVGQLGTRGVEPRASHRQLGPQLLLGGGHLLSLGFQRAGVRAAGRGRLDV